MFDWLPAGIGELSAGAVLVIVVLMILTDRLVPRKRLEEAREQATLWQTNATEQQAINRDNAEIARANAKSLADHAEAALLQQRVMEAVQKKHLEGGGGV